MLEEKRNTDVLQQDAVTMLEQLSLGVLLSDAQGQVLYANPAFYNLFGQSADDELTLIRQSCSDPDVLMALLEGKSTRAELLLTDERTLEVEVVSLEDRRLWQFTDITRLKTLERAKKTIEEYLQAIYEYVPVGIFTLDKNGIITNVEGRRTQGSMMHRENVIGMSVYDLLQVVPLPYIQESLKQVYAGERVDGSIELFSRTYEAHLTPLFDAEGNVNGARGVFYEATERRRTEEALRQSVEKSDTILENIEDGYYEVDLHGNFTVVNDAFARILGYPKEEVVGQDTNRYVRYTDEENANKVQRAFNEVYRSGNPARVEAKVIHPNGNEHYVDISVALIRDANGNPIGFRGITRDITERKRTEEALRQRMSLLSILQKTDLELNQALDVGHVLSVALNAAAQLTDAEHAYIGLIQNERVRLVRTFGGYSKAPDLSVYVGITGRVIRTQQAELILDVHSDPDYHEVIPGTKAMIASPMISYEQLLGVLTLATAEPEHFTAEVFEFVQLLAARVAAALDNARLYELSQGQLADLRELEQLKTDIIRVASHDIRSPISVVSGYLDILHDDFAEHMREEHHEFFNAIYTAIRRMQRMATDILSLDRVQMAKTMPETIVYMNDVMRKALMDVRDEANLKGQTLNVSLPDELLPVYGEDVDLAEATANLLSNATKYTPEGGKIAVRLQSVSDDEGQWAVVEIEDTGIGIDPEHQDRLFQPFYRVKNDKTHRIDGTGLGLYLVKKIVEAHGGRIRFHSVVGQGSMFGFQLPLVEAK